MGKHTDKFLRDRADHLRLYIYANLAVAGACLADYFLFGHPYALESLVAFVLLINGFALWQQNHDYDRAYDRDIEDEKEMARLDAQRDERLRSRGLKLE